MGGWVILTSSIVDISTLSHLIKMSAEQRFISLSSYCLKLFYGKSSQLLWPCLVGHRLDPTRASGKMVGTTIIVIGTTTTGGNKFVKIQQLGFVTSLQYMSLFVGFVIFMAYTNTYIFELHKGTQL